MREDLDPEAVGGMLSRLYSGVRRAEAEETTELILPPAGAQRRRTTVMTLSQEARDLSWLVNAFAERVPGVAHAVVVSSDGLLVAISASCPGTTRTSSRRSPRG